MATRSAVALAQSAPEADPVRRALEEAKSRPLPSLEERERLMALAREAMGGPFVSTEDFMARLPPSLRAAMARAAEAERALPSAAE